ncbi:MAG TPA: glycosyltransferase family 2 protein, partial [Actinoplanes sp.]
VTQALFRAATGRGVQDTQTGLRAYPASLLGWLRTIPGERFEYEMNVLLEAARAGHRIEEVVITTTYLDENASSHFSPLSDSARIYWPLLRYAAATLLTPARAGR